MDDKAGNCNEAQIVCNENVPSTLLSLWDLSVKKLQYLYDGDIDRVKKHYVHLIGIYLVTSVSKDESDFHRELEVLDGIIRAPNNDNDDNSICGDWEDDYDSKSDTEMDETDDSSHKSVTSCDSDTFTDTKSETSSIFDSNDSDDLEAMDNEKEKEAKVTGNLIESLWLLCDMDTAKDLDVIGTIVEYNRPVGPAQKERKNDAPLIDITSDDNANEHSYTKPSMDEPSGSQIRGENGEYSIQYINLSYNCTAAISTV